MTKELFFETLGDINENYVNYKEEKKPAPKGSRWKPWAAAAACLVIAAMFLFEVLTTGERIPLSADSKGVTVQYTTQTPPHPLASLVGFEEKELFDNPNFALSAFRGTITQVDNIVLSFNGDSAYRAIAQIQVSKVYRGDAVPGEIVSVLLPYAVGTEWKAEDTEVSSAMKAGMEGIFVPVAYDGNSTWQQNGATLYLRDLAPYGLADGHRWAFLETDGGLLYAEDAYPGAAGAATLDDIETYVVGMLEKDQ